MEWGWGLIEAGCWKRWERENQLKRMHIGELKQSDKFWVMTNQLKKSNCCQSWLHIRRHTQLGIHWYISQTFIKLWQAAHNRDPKTLITLSADSYNGTHLTAPTGYHWIRQESLLLLGFGVWQHQTTVNSTSIQSNRSRWKMVMNESMCMCVYVT